MADPDLLVLDAGTSDRDSRLMSGYTLGPADGDYTIFTVAHRLSTVADADRIHSIEGGQVVGTGDHRERMENGGTYAALFRAQSEDS